MMKSLTILATLLALVVMLGPNVAVPAPTTAAPVVSPDGWELQYTAPPLLVSDLYGIWGSSHSDVFAVGDEGHILHYDGTTWSHMTSGTFHELRSIWGSSHSDVFAVGNVGTILHYDGAAWSHMTSGTTEDLHGIWGDSHSDVFAVGAHSTILHYDGSSWRTVFSGTTTQRLFGVWGSSSSDVFAVGQEGTSTILHYDGSSWSPMSSVTDWLYGVWGSSSSDVFAASHSGTILHYDGSSWSPMASGIALDLNGIWGSSSSDVFAVGEGGTITYYDGAAWSRMQPHFMESINGVWGASGCDVFAVASMGGIIHYDGHTWSNMTSGTARDLNGIWGSAWDDVFAVGDSGTILHYNGTGWSSTASGSTANLNGIWGSSAADIFAVGDSGIILHYDGDTWAAMTSDTTASLCSVWGSSSSDVYAVGNMQVANMGLAPYPKGYMFHYDGVTWRKAYAVGEYGSHLDYVWGSSSSDVFALGADFHGYFDWPWYKWVGTYSHLVLHYDGHSWSEPSVGTALNNIGDSIWGTSPSDLYTVNGEGTISHYDGTTWSAMTSGTTSSLSLVWGTSSGDDVFVVGDGGTILHYHPGPEGPPAIESLDDGQGSPGQAASLTIRGANFTGASSVSFGDGITVNSFTVASKTRIVANVTIGVNAITGARDVTVAGPLGTGTKAGAFTVRPPAPTITSISPTEGKQGDYLDVTITGANLDGATAVTFGEGITVNSFNVDSPTQITANITVAEDAALGARDVAVTTPGGTATLTEGFTVTAKDSEEQQQQTDQEENQQQEGDEEKKNSGGGGCSCGTVSENTPPNELLIGWGIIGFSAAAAYWVATKIPKRWGCGSPACHHLYGSCKSPQS